MPRLRRANAPRYAATSLFLVGNSALGEPIEPDAALFPSPPPATEVFPVAPPSDIPGDCGVYNETVPNFSLIDQNPNSPSYGESFTRDTFQSQVLVIYWALAS